MDDFLGVLDGGFGNLNSINDAFEGKGQQKDEFDIVYDVNEPGGIKFKKSRKKGPVKRKAP